MLIILLVLTELGSPLLTYDNPCCPLLTLLRPRNMALMVILTRAGLGLDAAALRRLSLVVLRLAFTPCLSETLTVGIAAHLLLGFPWIWGFMLG